MMNEELARMAAIWALVTAVWLAVGLVGLLLVGLLRDLWRGRP